MGNRIPDSDRIGRDEMDANRRRNARRAIAAIAAVAIGYVMGECQRRAAKYVANRLVDWADKCSD